MMAGCKPRKITNNIFLIEQDNIVFILGQYVHFRHNSVNLISILLAKEQIVAKF